MRCLDILRPLARKVISSTEADVLALSLKGRVCRKRARPGCAVICDDENTIRLTSCGVNDLGEQRQIRTVGNDCRADETGFKFRIHLVTEPVRNRHTGSGPTWACWSTNSTFGSALR